MILAQETKQTNKQTKNTKSYVAMALGNIHCKSKIGRILAGFKIFREWYPTKVIII